MSDGAKDKTIAEIDDESKKPTSDKIPREENMLNNEMAATDAKSYTLTLNEEVYKISKVTLNWNPEILKVKYDDYHKLEVEEKRLWLQAHFLLRRFASIFDVDAKRPAAESDDDLFS